MCAPALYEGCSQLAIRLIVVPRVSRIACRCERWGCARKQRMGLWQEHPESFSGEEVHDRNVGAEFTDREGQGRQIAFDVTPTSAVSFCAAW